VNFSTLCGGSKEGGEGGKEGKDEILSGGRKGGREGGKEGKDGS